MNLADFILALALLTWTSIPVCIAIASTWQTEEDSTFDWIQARYGQKGGNQ